MLLTARSVVAGGRARATMGGRTVPAGLLGEAGAELVTMHGQSDQARLRSPARQRDALDAFAGNEVALAAYRSAWSALLAAERRLDDITTAQSNRAAEAAELSAGLAEIERVDPEPAEDERLDAEIARLEHTERLRTGAQTGHRLLAGIDWDGPSVATAVEQARRTVAEAADIDPSLRPVAERLAELGYLTNDLIADLAGYLDRLDSDPARLAAAQQRRWDLGALRRYGGTVGEILDWASAAGKRLAEIGDPEATLAAAAATLEGARAHLTESATELTATRRAAADRLGVEVTAELADLAMPDAVFTAVVTGAAPGPAGADEIRFELVPHPGAAPVPVTSGASGGELSRIMLALELALAGSARTAPGPFVFDEVDAGVGGAAAVEVGRRLARLSRSYQVIVVTHLAQVAAFADTHIVVTKTPATETGLVTASDVRTVAGAERIVELARMLSGKVTETARAHAAELLAQAGVGR